MSVSDKQRVRIYQIATEMKSKGLSNAFIADAVKLAEIYEGAYGLFDLWATEKDSKEKDHIIADIQDEIDEYKEQPQMPIKKPYISCNDLEMISKKAMEFKTHLKTKVDQWGGISKLSEETGIPEPSLIRFFKTASIFRRTTINKIAKALNLSEKEINIFLEGLG